MLPKFPERIRLAFTPTPLRLLNNVSKEIGCNIWLKCDDQSGSILSGNKVRKLEFLLAEAIQKNTKVIITCGGIQSNHCRATAAACAQLGIQCHLILRDGDSPDDPEEPDGNWLLDTLCGAQIDIISAKDYRENFATILDKLQNHYRNQNLQTYFIPTGGSNETGIWGYIAAAEEIKNSSFDHPIDAIVSATGSGGTQAGLTLGMSDCKTPVYGMAVCDSKGYFKNKILTDVAAWRTKYGSEPVSLNINTIDKYIGPGYAKGYPELFNTIRWLAKSEGVILDPVYTGKAFFGMLEELATGEFVGMKNIIFVHTGGIFGVFPKRKNILGEEL